MGLGAENADCAVEVGAELGVIPAERWDWRTWRRVEDEAWPTAEFADKYPELG